mmetsp:Transcript_11799/g.28942  ORF Transcript_11799/g.28942 Transcript_11799/m.28942 type:complete len:255 (+) Transcript_11799:37-801(+)
MSDNVRQRRGKKSSGATAAAGASETSSEAKSGGNPPTPIDQLHSAKAKLIMSRDRTADLHRAWKAQLFRLSILVVFVAIYQLQTSVSTCIGEIKESNETFDGDHSVAIVTGVEAIKLIFGDNFCEVLGVFIASILAYFLALSNMEAMQLEHWSYMLSSALVPVCLGFFFHSKQLGCLREEIIVNTDELTKDQRHQFPAVVIYHTIVTVAFWFMKSGMKQCEDHVQLVSNSIEDFARMEKKMEKKKQLKLRKRNN